MKPLETRPNVNYGPAELAYAGEIFRATVGSKLHGLSVGGQDDTDEMGIYIPPPSHVLGLKKEKTHTWRTQPEGVRSGPGDTDRVIYTLREFMSLAVAGNPTILATFFVPQESIILNSYAGYRLLAMAPKVISRQAGNRFLGYLNQQRGRMDGVGKVSRMPKRPELVKEYGYDVKYAGHALRLGLQGIELLTTGRMVLPMPEPDRSTVLSVRRGEVDKQAARDLIDWAANRLVMLVHGHGELAVPEKPDYNAVNRYLEEAHLLQWGYIYG